MQQVVSLTGKKKTKNQNQPQYKLMDNIGTGLEKQKKIERLKRKCTCNGINLMSLLVVSYVPYPSGSCCELLSVYSTKVIKKWPL